MKTKTRRNRQYTDAQREEAVKLLDNGMKVIAVAKKLKIPISTVTNWRNGAMSFDGTGVAVAKENARLREENTALREIMRNMNKLLAIW